MTQATRFHAQPPRLCNATRHPVVFERTRGVEALMLEHEAGEPAVFCGERAFKQRRVALAQRDDVAIVVYERKELPIAPDAALAEWGVRHATLPPGAFQARDVQVAEVILSFEKAAALRAIIKDCSNVVLRTAGAVKTSKMRLHGKYDFSVAIRLNPGRGRLWHSRP